MIYLILKDFKNLSMANYTCTILAVLLFILADTGNIALMAYTLYYLGFSVMIHRQLILDNRLFMITSLNILGVITIIAILYYIDYPTDTLSTTRPTTIGALIVLNLGMILNGYIIACAFIYITLLACYNTQPTSSWVGKLLSSILGAGKYYFILIATIFSIVHTIAIEFLPIPLIMFSAWTLRYIVEKPPTKRKKREVRQHSHSM